MAKKTDPPKRPSKITVPAHGHPLARLVFQLMRDSSTTYDELEFRSGVLRQTFKAWRTEKQPGLRSIEAVLGSFGWTLVPVPPLGDLPPKTLEAIEDISLDFISDHAALAAIMATVCNVPVFKKAPPPVTITVKPTRVTNRDLPGQTALFLEDLR